MVPTLVAVLFAFVTGNMFNRSLYDTLIIMKNIPYMPYMRKDRTPDMKVSQIVTRECICVPNWATPTTLQEILHSYPEFSCFPVVDKDGYLVGAVKSRSLLHLLATQSQANPEQVAEYGDNEEFPASYGNMEYDDEEDDSIHSVDTLPITTSVNKDSKAKQSYRNSAESSPLLAVPSDVSPLLVTQDTPLSRVHFLFVMLMPKCAYVVNGGKLTGVVTRLDIIECGQSNDS